MRTAACWTLACALAVLGCGCESGAKRDSTAKTKPPVVTLAEYQRVRLGMSYVKVAGIIGAPGVEIARNYTPGIKGALRNEPMQAYVWANPVGSSMLGVFREGDLVQVMQTGLR